MILEKLLLLLHNSLGPFRDYRSAVRKTIHKWETLETLVNLPRTGCHWRFILKLDCEMLRGIQKNPGPSESLQASLSVFNVKILGSTIKRKLNKFSLFGRVSRRRSVFRLLLIKVAL